MSDLIGRFYQGQGAEEYEARRSQNPKWQFEHQVLLDVLQELRSEIQSVVDVPVGTGRFIGAYAALGSNVAITGVDYSVDMLEIAKRRAGALSVRFLRHDIMENPLPEKADMAVCYRFLNLFKWHDACCALTNILLSARKYVLFTIRSISDDYHGEVVLDDKIHLHRHAQVVQVISDNGFKEVKRYAFHDNKGGEYSVMLCGRVSGFRR